MGKKPKKLRPPPRGSKCDASVGVNYDGPAPTLISCKNEATVTLPPGRGGPWESWVCASCGRSLRLPEEAT